MFDKPLFQDIADDFLNFVGDSKIVIHNAPFDSGFQDHELGLIGSITLAELCSRVIDTLQMARSLRPGRKNSLDALCAEFGIDNSSRQLHGALRDAELLAGVWLAMTRGQESLVLDPDMPEPKRNAISTDRLPLKVLGADEADLLEHERVLCEIDKESKGRCV